MLLKIKYFKLASRLFILFLFEPIRINKEKVWISTDKYSIIKLLDSIIIITDNKIKLYKIRFSNFKCKLFKIMINIIILIHKKEFVLTNCVIIINKIINGIKQKKLYLFKYRFNITKTTSENINKLL